jgi:hypothetical protein
LSNIRTVLTEAVDEYIHRDILPLPFIVVGAVMTLMAQTVKGIKLLLEGRVSLLYKEGNPEVLEEAVALP